MTSEKLEDVTVANAVLKNLLRAAGRYVEGYAENTDNHPQARDAALSLLAQIKDEL